MGRQFARCHIQVNSEKVTDESSWDKVWWVCMPHGANTITAMQDKTTLSHTCALHNGHQRFNSSGQLSVLLHQVTAKLFNQTRSREQVVRTRMIQPHTAATLELLWSTVSPRCIIEKSRTAWHTTRANAEQAEEEPERKTTTTSEKEHVTVLQHRTAWNTVDRLVCLRQRTTLL